jgi:DNA repair protein RadC
MSKQQLEETGLKAICDYTEVAINYKNNQHPEIRTKINCASDSYYFLKPYFEQEMQTKEQFLCLLMNNASEVIAVYKVSSGGICMTVADIRLILCAAINCLAVNLIVAHNHPSGNLNASESDKQLTARLKEGAKLLDITLLDHLILTDWDYYSFANEGGL